MCPNGVDLTVAVPEDDGDEDDFGEMDNPRAGPEPLPLSLVPVPKVVTFSERWQKKLYIGAGSSALIASGLYLAALSNRGKYDDVEDSTIQSQAELDALRWRTNGQVGLSVAFAGVGVGMATVAGFSGRW